MLPKSMRQNLVLLLAVSLLCSQAQSAVRSVDHQLPRALEGKSRFLAARSSSRGSRSTARSSSSSRSSTPNSSGSSQQKEGWGFAEAGFGVVMIFFALPMIWMNERKDVKIYKVITQGRENVIEADPNDPQEDNMHKLIHVKGETTTQSQTADEMFGLVYDEILKIKRTVEVFQWTENISQSGGSEEEASVESVTYEQSWKSHAVNQDLFRNPGACEGPANPKDDEWPCHSEEFINNYVDLGAMELSDQQIRMINQFQSIDLGEMQEQIASTSSLHFEQMGWMNLQEGQDGFLCSRTEANRYATEGLHDPAVGDMRIKWEIVSMQRVNIIAQQVVNEKKSDKFTFRPWNPNDEMAEVGAEEDQTEATCPVCCFPCWCVEKCFKTVFKEEVNVIQYDDDSADEIFDKMQEGNAGTTKCIRWCSWILSTLGHYMLFTPIIRLIAWIPLLGALLSKIIAFACLIFAVLWASMLHFSVMGVAWIFYRPLFGFMMLLGVAAIVTLMNYGDGSAYDISQIDLDIDQYYGTS